MELFRIQSLIPIVAVMACGQTEKVAPPVRLDGEYVAQCGTPSQCSIVGGPSHPQWFDSARVIFRTDGQAVWMRATGEISCPCYLSGCTCPPATHGVSRFDAMYSVTGSLVHAYDWDMFAKDAVQSPGPQELTVTPAENAATIRFVRVN